MSREALGLALAGALEHAAAQVESGRLTTVFEQCDGQRSGITCGVERTPPSHVNGQRQNGERLVVGILISLSDEAL